MGLGLGIALQYFAWNVFLFMAEYRTKHVGSNIVEKVRSSAILFCGGSEIF
jgi:hypothetical protein